jgi:hypothetical protein
MGKFGALLSGLAGILVLGGYFVDSLNKTYYLVLAGGILAIIAAFVSARNTY